MDQGFGGLEKDRPVKRLVWGLRPWKRHSTILAVVGFMFILAGFQYIFTSNTPGRERSLFVLLQIAPIQVWGGLLIIAGILAMLSTKWPPGAETWGYMVLTGLSSGWSATYLFGVIFFDAPVAAIGQSIIWAALAFMWWAISGFPNPERPRPKGE
jgi:hypothetical protein